MYRKYIGDLEHNYSNKYHHQLLKNQRDNKDLKFRVGVYENLNDTLSTKMRFLDEKTTTMESKVHFLLNENGGLQQELQKLKAENDELTYMLKQNGTYVHKYQREVDELDYREKKVRTELDKNNLDYHKSLLDLRQKLGLNSAKSENMQANYELMLKDKNDIIQDLHEQLAIKDRKLGMIKTMEQEIELMRDKYQNDMKANSDIIRKLQFQMDESHRYNFKDSHRFDRELEELKHKKMVREGK